MYMGTTNDTEKNPDYTKKGPTKRRKKSSNNKIQ